MFELSDAFLSELLAPEKVVEMLKFHPFVTDLCLLEKDQYMEIKVM